MFHTCLGRAGRSTESVTSHLESKVVVNTFYWQGTREIRHFYSLLVGVQSNTIRMEQKLAIYSKIIESFTL